MRLDALIEELQKTRDKHQGQVLEVDIPAGFRVWVAWTPEQGQRLKRYCTCRGGFKHATWCGAVLEGREQPQTAKEVREELWRDGFD